MHDLYRINGLGEPTIEAYLYAAGSRMCRGDLRDVWLVCARRAAKDAAHETQWYLGGHLHGRLQAGGSRPEQRVAPPGAALMDTDRGRESAARETVAHYAGVIGLSLLDARLAIQAAENMIQRGETAHRAITAGKGACDTLLLVRRGECVARYTGGNG